MRPSPTLVASRRFVLTAINCAAGSAIFVWLQLVLGFAQFLFGFVQFLHGCVAPPQEIESRV